MGGGEMAANLRTRMLLIRLLVAFVVAVAAVAAAAAGAGSNICAMCLS